MTDENKVVVQEQPPELFAGNFLFFGLFFFVHLCYYMNNELSYCFQEAMVCPEPATKRN